MQAKTVLIFCRFFLLFTEYVQEMQSEVVNARWLIVEPVSICILPWVAIVECLIICV